MRRLLILLLINFLLIYNCELISDNQNKYKNEIAIILNYLNEAPLKVYNYKDAILQSAHEKADVTELTLDVAVECLNKYPELPCDGNLLTCTGFVRQNTILGDVKCVPKLPPNRQPDDEPIPPAEIISPPNPNEQEQPVTLSNEAVSSETTGDHFVAVRRDHVCLGCPFDINPQAEGVQDLVNLALRHIESEHVNKQALVRIHRLQQQIVAGVKYILLIEVIPTICSKQSPLPIESCPLDFNSGSRICEIISIEQPWISRAKHIIRNNCTQSQEFVETNDQQLHITSPSDINNEIGINDNLPSNNQNTKPAFLETPNYDHIAESGSIDDDTMSLSRLSDLESQILFGESIDLPSPSPTRPQQQQQQQPPYQEIVQPTEFFAGSSSSINYDQEVVDDRPNNGENTENIENVAPTTTNDYILMEIPIKKQDEINIFNKFAEILIDLAKYENLTTNNDESSTETTSAEIQDTDEMKRFEIPFELKTTEQLNASQEQKSQQSSSASSSEESNEGSRVKRAIRQLEKITPEEKSLVRDLADYAANTLDNLDDDNHKRIVLQILGAKKLVADDGTYYHLILRLGISQCLENGRLNPTENCREKLFENYTKICKVQIFVDEDYTIGPKLIKSQCQNIKRDNKNDTNRTNYSRYRRKRGELIGGPHKLEKDNAKVLDLLENGLRQLDNIEGNRNKYKSIDILSATSQVVNGVLYKIQASIILTECDVNDTKLRGHCDQLKDVEPRICEFKVWDRPWLTEMQRIDINCNNLDKKISKREARHGVPGAPINKPINDSSVIRLVEDSLKKLETDEGSRNKYKHVEILSATSQVVSGALYKIRASIISTACNTDDPTPRKQCSALEGGEERICDFEIWERPWLSDQRITINCPQLSTKKVKRQTRVGAPEKIPIDDPEVIRLMEDSLKKLETDEGSDNKYKHVEILSATSQIVSGILYKIQASIISTTCNADDPTPRKQCTTLQGAEERTCEFQIWEQAWLHNQQITVNCPDANKKKVKRQTRVGAPEKIPIDDPEVIRLMEDSLKKLETDEGSHNKYKHVEILSATSQIVSGILYKIRASIISTTCNANDLTPRKQCTSLEGAEERTCEFQIWEQAWLHNQQITVNCPDVNKKKKKRQIYDDNDNHHGLVGAPIKIPTNDPRVVRLIEDSLKKLESNEGSNNKYKHTEILSATSQVVSGSLYNIRASIISTTCNANDPTPRKQCTSLEGAEERTCEFQIWERPWLNDQQITVNCENPNKRAKRSNNKSDYYLMDLLAFQNFTKKYNKNYLNQNEYKHRFKIFRKNLKYIHMLNTYEQGTAAYGVTKFTDLSRKEFSRMLGLRPELHQANEIPFEQAIIPDFINEDIPVEFDWRQKGVVTDVKDQGQCGSCWAFSVTGNVEGQYALKYKRLLEFSEQELVDCDTTDNGCDGGLMDNAYRAIEKLGGLETEKDYPYDAENERCHFNKTLAQVQLSGGLNISTNETDMAKWLVKNGPISIAINANAMQFYMGGISHPLRFLCNPKNLDHGVLIVGYGLHTYPLFHRTLPYWIVKNSWGKSWGEQGYYRVYRGDGTCGVNQTPSSAIVV